MDDLFAEEQQILDDGFLYLEMVAPNVHTGGVL